MHEVTGRVMERVELMVNCRLPVYKVRRQQKQRHRRETTSNQKRKRKE